MSYLKDRKILVGFLLSFYKSSTLCLSVYWCNIGFSIIVPQVLIIQISEKRGWNWFVFFIKWNQPFQQSREVQLFSSGKGRRGRGILINTETVLLEGRVEYFPFSTVSTHHSVSVYCTVPGVHCTVTLYSVSLCGPLYISLFHILASNSTIRLDW